MDDFGYLKSSLYIISIRNATNLRKKNYGIRTLRAEPSPPLYELLARSTLPPPSLRTLWMTPYFMYIWFKSTMLQLGVFVNVLLLICDVFILPPNEFAQGH